MPTTNDTIRHPVLTSQHNQEARSQFSATASLPRNRVNANETASPALDSFRTAWSLAEVILLVCSRAFSQSAPSRVERCVMLHPARR